MMDFSIWFINQIPAFLMSDPIIYLVSLFLLGVICDLFKRMIRLGR